MSLNSFFPRMAVALLLLAAAVLPASARGRQRRSLGLEAGGIGTAAAVYQHETGKDFNNAVTYTAGSWFGYDITLAQQSRRYFGELYLRPVLGAGLMETLVSYRSRTSALVGIHGIAGLEYSFNDKVFAGVEGLVHLVLFDVIFSGDNEGLGSYFGRQLFFAPGLYIRYAF